ncbi:MAG: Wzz/FepE/Etk N-terminal domain-containing protein, partial [Gemmatimonadaceae bacterium]
MTNSANDEVDLMQLLRTLALRWWWLLLGAVLGLGGAMLVLWLVPAKFESNSRVLIRTANDPTAGLRSKLGPIAELAPSALGGGKAEELDTELEILRSRSVIGAVVDSLRLQVLPVQPARVAPASIVDSVKLQGRFKPHVVDLVAGANTFPEGGVWIHAGSAAIRARIYDREEAIDNASDDLDVKQRSGDVVGIRYRAHDSLSVAAAPNLLVQTYLVRRRGVDRGINQRRLEFLMAAVDSVQAELRASGRKLRVSQENEGVLDPTATGKAMLEQFSLLEGSVTELRAQENSLDSMLSNAAHKDFDPRRL